MPEKDNQNRQLDLKLGYSKAEILYKLKRLASNVEKNFTALPFWRNGLIWAKIISVFSVSVISLLLIGKSYSKLPPQIPLVYNTQEEEWKLIPKIFVFTVPFGFLMLGVANIQLLRRVYYMNKKLTLMICFTITITYLLGLLAVNEILLISTS